MASVFPASESISTAREDARRAREQVSQIIGAWPEQEVFDATAVLRDHADLDWDKSALLDVAYEEFCQRTEAGQAPDVDAFVARFPDVQESLRELVRVHATMSRDAASLARFQTAWPKQGDSFLGFRLTEELGKGAFSRVFRATEDAIGEREVVVKICQRGRTEAQTLGRIEHARIVPIHSIRSDAETGLSAICMPFVSRATLFDVLDLLKARGEMPKQFAAVLERVGSLNAAAGLREQAATPGFRGSYVDGVLRIGQQIAEALHYAHQRGFLHCDVKPSNVLVTSDGDCFVLDFNLAQSRSGLRGVGGTVPYMSPEQFRAILDGGDKPISIDARSDLFSLGVTLYELLCGEPPFGPIPPNLSQERAAEMLLAKQAAGLTPLDQRNRAVDRQLATLVARCLQFDPADRPQTAADLGERLRHAVSFVPRTRRFARLHRRAALIAGGATLAAAGTAAYGWINLEPYPIRRLNDGWTAVRKKQWKTAIVAFDEAIAAQNQPPLEAYFGRGLAHLRAGNLGPAITDLDHVYEPGASPNVVVAACRAECMIRTAIAEQTPAGYMGAQLLYKEILSLGKESPADLNNLAFCYLQTPFATDRLARAARALKGAIHQDPYLRPALYNLVAVDIAHAIRSLAKSVALRHVERALRLDPPVAETHADAAALYAAAVMREGLPTQQGRRHLNKVIEHYLSAVRLGIAPQEVSQHIGIFSPSELRNHPRLRKLSTAGRSLSLNNRVADSLDGADPRTSYLTGH